MYAIIEPVTVFPSTATVLFINNVNVQPGASASYQWWLQSAPNGATLTTGTINLTGDAYSQWGTDDDYLYTYTATVLGLTIVEIVPDAPPVDAPAPVVAPSDEAAPAVDGGTDE